MTHDTRTGTRPAPLPPAQSAARLCPEPGYAGGMGTAGNTVADCRTVDEVGRALALGQEASCEPEVAAECGAPGPGDPQCAEPGDLDDSEPPAEHWD